jgi:hypothetical protein
VLEVSIGWLLTPPPGENVVEMAPGVLAERDVILQALLPVVATDKPLDQELQDAFSQVVLHVRLLSRAADHLQEDMERMQRLALAARQAEREAGPG